ncbi:MAG TPA: polyprenyl synthetase family protein [Pedococcus sp.]
MTAVATDALALARSEVRSGLRHCLDRLDPRMRLVCGYHLGLWDAEGRPTEGGGKGVRPELVLLTTRAVGADPCTAVPAAVAVELVHNFSLVHDDVMDGDTRRRHQPTVWSVFGVSTAILAGDALLGLAEEVLAGARSPNVGVAVRALSATARRLIAGQVADLAFEERHDVDLAECLRMEADKTGALLACACSLGPVLADAPAALATALADFGERVGVAFQLQDDLLGVWGEPAVTGKPVLSDLRARKKSAPVVAALTSGTTAGVRLGRLYAQPGALSEEDLVEAASLVEAAGGRDWALHRATEELDAALGVLAESVPDPTLADPLRDLAHRLAGRDH